MHIDWLTVTAQIINFLALVWLLHRFLYRPIVKAMERREARIASRLNDASSREDAAKREEAEYRAKGAAIDAERDRLLSEARKDAESLRQRLDKDVREEMEGLRRRLRDHAESEREAFLNDVKRRAVDGFAALARRALRDLADARLEEQIGQVFTARIAGLDAEARRAIVDAATAAGGRVAVFSAFELPTSVRRQITQAVRDVTGADTEISYEQTDELNCGIELRAAGQVITWSLDSYLGRLERDLRDGLNRTAAGPGAASRLAHGD